jgi:uncharacterized membrane protein
MKPWFLDYEHCVVLVHHLKIMASFTVLFGDRVVLVHDLKTMVSFTVFAKDRAVLVHDLKTMVLFTDEHRK